MPLKLYTGISKKLGCPTTRSSGATCHVEVELDAGLLTYDLEGLHQHVHNAYVACSQAVNDELARHREAMRDGFGAGQRWGKNNTSPQDTEEGRIHQTPDGGNGQGAKAATRRSRPRLARSSSSAFWRAKSEVLGSVAWTPSPETLCSKPLSGLTNAEASALIDVLKNVQAGNFDLEAALNGAGT